MEYQHERERFSCSIRRMDEDHLHSLQRELRPRELRSTDAISRAGGVRGNKEHVASHGYACEKGAAH